MLTPPFFRPLAPVPVEFKGETKQFAAEEISSMVLGKMKEVAETFLGKPVKKVGAGYQR